MSADALRARVVLLVIRSIVVLTGLLLALIAALLLLDREVDPVLWSLLGGGFAALTTLLANSKGTERPEGTPADPVAVQPVAAPAAPQPGEPGWPGVLPDVQGV